MATSNKVVVVERKDGVGRVEELRVEDNLDAIGRVVEKLHTADLVENGILMIVEHVMGDNWGKSVALHGKEATTKQNSVLGGDKLLLIGQRFTLVPLEGALKEATSNALLDNVCGVAQGLDNCLALERLDSEGLETVVQSCQRLNKHVNTLIPELVTTSSEKIECVINIEVVVAIEMSADKVVDLLLCLLVQVLELVNSRELCDVETIRQNAIGLSLQQMLRLKSCDMRNSGENIASMCGGSLNTVSVVYTTLASFSVDIEPLQVVVKVHGAGAKVSAEKSSVCGKDRRNIDAAPLAEGQGNASKPLVEVSNNSLLLLVADELRN
ncbi:hypothetical protein HG531_011614 [Fusarium graminearum]|nr:hypothetical protein HG531_011614 [Fusarium graminearum]